MSATMNRLVIFVAGILYTTCIALSRAETCTKSLVSRMSCTQQCGSDVDCPADSRCLCDGRCGLSCVNKGLNCNQPPRVRNAKFTTTGNSFNDKATYTCNDGYSLNGSPRKRCTAKGKWDGVGPTCMQACKQPHLPFGAYVKSIIKSAYKTGDRIQLGCKKGFKQVGNPTRICISGRWTAFPFKCKATGSCQRTTRASRTKCTRKCSPQDATTCKQNEKCVCDGQCGYSCAETGLSCGEPPSIKNGFKEFNSTGYNAIVRYWCKQGFTLDGVSVKRCTAKKRWDQLTPNCLLDCRQPLVPPNAFIENKQPKYASGDRVTFKCKPGYHQEGIPSRLCFMGRWNIIPFKCEVGGCNDPGEPVNGRKVGIFYEVNSEVYFSCNLGYNLIGSEQRQCLANNTWSGVQPICKIVDCGEIPPPRNGRIHGNETTFEKSITYSCDPGFEMKGPKTAICQSNGRWSVVSKCEVTGCKQPRVPPNAIIQNKKSKYASGDRVTFKCKPGYHQEGIPSTLCFMGKWNIIPFKCEVRGCGDPGEPVNGNKVGISYGVNSEVYFSCNLGYNLIGSEKRQCLSNNTWSGVQPICKIVDCSEIPPPRNGRIHGNETTFQKSITYSCDPGFELKGPKNAICQSDGRWSVVSKCEVTGCKQPRVPPNAFIENKKLKYESGNRVTFRCQTGYRRRGVPSTVCFMGRWWNILPFKCEAKQQRN